MGLSALNQMAIHVSTYLGYKEYMLPNSYSFCYFWHNLGGHKILPVQLVRC